MQSTQETNFTALPIPMGARRNFSRGGNVEILLILFRLLTMKCKWTFTKRFSLSTPQSPMLQQNSQNCVLCSIIRGVGNFFFQEDQTEPQASNQRGRSSPRKCFAPLEKCTGYNLRILSVVQKIWAPLGKFFAPPGVPSWLRACRAVTQLGAPRCHRGAEIQSRRYGGLLWA